MMNNAATILHEQDVICTSVSQPYNNRKKTVHQVLNLI